MLLSDGILLEGLINLYVSSEVSYEPLTSLPTDAVVQGQGQGAGKKVKEVVVRSFKMEPEKTDFTPGGLPTVSAAILKKMAGKNVFSEGTSSHSFLTLFSSFKLFVIINNFCCYLYYPLLHYCYNMIVFIYLKILITAILIFYNYLFNKSVQ